MAPTTHHAGETPAGLWMVLGVGALVLGGAGLALGGRSGSVPGEAASVGVFVLEAGSTEAG
jgi:hypothetical protein